MAIANKNDLTHVVRTTQQWESSYDKYECIPEGVLCIEFTTSGQALAKIGNGRDIFSKLPYIGGADLTNYFTKEQTTECINDILKAKRYICIKGILNNKNQLPTNATCGDLYFVISQNQSSSNKYDEYVYSPNNTWENLGSIPIDIDLSEYAKIVYVDEKIDEVNERIDDIEQHGTHTHANKDILDLITAAFTAEEKDKLSTLYNYDDTELRELITQASHTHSNKDILDAISAPFTKEDKSKLDQLNPYDDSILKEKITALERLAHEHSNKRILDRTTASFTTEYERKMRWIRLYTGCTGMEEGIAGLVPAAQAGEEDYVLSGSGEWVPQTGGGGTYTLPIATASTLGGIKVGNGLEIDANGVLSTTGGGGGGDSIAEGGGITITTDPQTGVKTISVNAGTNLEIDPVTGELNVTGGSGEGNYSAGEAINIRNISGNLPPGYVEVDYIEGNGNCYTVIDYIPNRKTKIVGSAALISTTNDPVLFGARTGSNGNQFVLWFNRYDSTQAKVGFVYGTNTWSTSTDCNDGRLIPYVVGEQFTFLLSLDDEFNINDTFVHNITENGAPADYLKLGIFALVDDSSGNIESDNQIFAGRMYEFKIYEDDVLVVELIPAVNSTTGSVGFYDTVNDKFYTSNRSTQFTYDPSTVHVSGKIIDVKYGDGLTVNQDNELEVNTGNGLQINQDGEIEIDPSIIPDVPDYRAGDAIEIEHNEYHLSLTDYSNNDFIASIILSVTNGSISKAADNSSFVLSSSYDDCYTRGSNYGSNGSYPYTVKPLTQYRLQWDSASPGVTGYTMIFENGEYTYVHTGDQGTVSYIDFTTAETTTFIQVRFGIAYAGNTISISNIRLYEYVEDAFEYDKINVKYNKGLVVNQNNELEVALSDGLQFDSTASETMVADEMYLFDSRVTCQVHTDSPYTGFPSNRTYQKTTIEPALCCLWEVGGADLMWTGPLIIGLTETSVQYTTQDTSQTVNYQNTFTYLGKTWYTSGYPDFLNGADHEDKLGHLQYLGSYSTTADQIQAAKDLIDLANVRFVSNAGIQAKLGDGLQFDNNGAIEAPVMGASGTNHSSGLVPDPGSTAGTTKFLREDGTWAEPESGGETYEAGNGIEITEVTHEDEFRVQNQEYFFDTRGLTCGLNARVWTTVNDGDILAAMCIHNNGGNQVPLFVGLTEDSVKVSQNYDSNILGPNGSFDYRGKTWYFTADYALSGTDGQDTQNHIQTLPTTYSFSSTPSNFVPAAKDLIDLAVLLPDVSTPTINAKIGNGLSFDANGAIQADAQPLSPATDSTLGGVIIGDGILVDNDGTISVDPTIIPEVIEYEAGTAISIEDVEHGGVTFDAWDSGTGWENVCYSDSTGNSVINYQYEAHSPISNSYTLPAGATHIHAIAYDQNDTMLWTSFSWIDSNNYHFASTSPEDGHYDDWFEIPTGAVKVNFGVRHSKLNTTTAMSLNDIKSVDITVQTVSEIEVDVWNGGTGWLNGDYTSGNSDSFATNWYYTYHYNYQQYIEVPEGATHVMVRGISNENDSHFEGGGINAFDSNHHHVHWWGCAWEWHEISSDVKYVQPNVKWNNNNTRTISGSDVKSVTLVWKLPALEINQGINVKYGNGLTVNQNNELEVDLGSGLQFDANGAIEVVGGGSSGGNGDYSAGEAIEFETVTDTHDIVWNMLQMSHTWVNKAYTAHVGGVFTNDSLCVHSDITPLSNLFSIPQNGTIYTIEARDQNDNLLHCIIDYHDGNGNHLDWNGEFISDPTKQYTSLSSAIYISVGVVNTDHSTPLAISNVKSVTLTWKNVTETSTEINVKYGTGLSVDPVTNELFVDGQLPEGTIIKKLTYTGNGSGSSNVIKFTKKPVGILSINGSSGTNYISAIPALINSEYLHGVYGGVSINGNSCSCKMSYNDATNELTFTQAYNGNNDPGLIYNADGKTYTMQYLVKGHAGSGTSETNMVSVVKTFSYVGTGASTNNIQFPETPDMLLSIAGIGGDNTYLTTTPTPMDAAKLDFAISDGNNNNGVGGALMSFNDTTNVLTLTSSRYDSWAFNASGVTYQVRYIVNEVISSSIGGGTNYIPGEGIEFTELSSSLYADKVRMEITGIKSYSQSGSYAPYVQMRYLEFSDENHDEITLTSGTGIWDDGTPVEYPNPGENIDAMIAEMIANTGKMIATKFDGTKSLILTFDLSTPVSYDDLQYLRYKTGNDAPERDPISWKIYFNNTNSVNNWNLAAVVESASITGNREAWTQYFPLAVNEFNTVVISATGGSSGDTVAEGNGISITTDSQTGVKTIGVNVGNGLEIDPNTGTLNVTGSSGGGSGNYSAGEAIDIRQSILTNNIDAIRWDISEIKTNGGAWTQVRYVEFCDSSGTTQILSTGSGIWEDNTAVTYSHDPAGGGSQEITDMIANTRKMCAAWRGPGHTLKLTFILDTATAPSNIVKFRMKTGDDEVGRDPKVWKIYVRDSVTQRWYLVHETENAEVTNNRSTWSNYYNFSTPSDTSINVKYGTGLSVDPLTNELEIDDSVVTEDDELTLVFVPDDYQPS